MRLAGSAAAVLTAAALTSCEPLATAAAAGPAGPIAGIARAAHRWTVPGVTGPPGQTADPSGVPVPTGNLPGWRQVFADNFTTSIPLGGFPRAVSTRWTAYSGFTDTFGHGYYDPSRTISVRDGTMDIYLHTEHGRHLVAAPVPIIPGRGAYRGGTYGRYAVRFRADPAAGYKTAWLLWPDADAGHPGGNWNNGEIDFPEGNLDGPISAFLHHRGNPRGADAYPSAVGYGGWHTAVVEWTPGRVTFTLDGRTVGIDARTGDLPTTPMHWVLQTETAATPPSDTATSTVRIDWVSIWSRA